MTQRTTNTSTQRAANTDTRMPNTPGNNPSRFLPLRPTPGPLDLLAEFPILINLYLKSLYI
jgi:hypothetical protein